MKKGETIQIEVDLPVSTDAVWQAITDPEQMRQWYLPMLPDFQAEVGFKVEFNMECEGRTFLHQWEVIEADDGRRIVYNWRYAGIPGDSNVSWELTKSGDATRLSFTHTALESFDSNDPLFSRESCQTGWEYFLNGQLPSFFKNE